MTIALIQIPYTIISIKAVKDKVNKIYHLILVKSPSKIKTQNKIELKPTNYNLLKYNNENPLKICNDNTDAYKKNNDIYINTKNEIYPNNNYINYDKNFNGNNEVHQEAFPKKEINNMNTESYFNNMNLKLNLKAEPYTECKIKKFNLLNLFNLNLFNLLLRLPKLSFSSK